MFNHKMKALTHIYIWESLPS